MNTPNNAAALERLEREMRDKLAKGSLTTNSTWVDRWADELATLRATLAPEASGADWHWLRTDDWSEIVQAMPLGDDRYATGYQDAMNAVTRKLCSLPRPVINPAHPDALTSQPSGGTEAEDRFEQYVATLIDKNPDVRRLGERLADWLDEDRFNTVNPILLGICERLATHPSADAPGVAVVAATLEWSSTLCNGERVNHAKAEKACAALGEGWRLPTRMELESILDLTRHDPAIDTERFPDTKSGAYWSSTPRAWAPSCAWFVNFDGGGAYGYSRDFSSAFVRAVRSVPTALPPAKENGITTALAPKPEGGHG